MMVINKLDSFNILLICVRKLLILYVNIMTCSTVSSCLMIEESIKSVFTQFNFFIHNLAQLKFSSHNEGALLSFVPKTYSMSTDGKIERVKLFSIQKRYTPEKRYIYIFQIEREKQQVPSYIFRMFAEFVEFRDKLAAMFPLIQWPNFSTRMVLGRSNIRSVAESRKVEIEQFLEYLLVKAPEISQCDLVYTFFHTLLRDEQEEASKLKVAKLREPIISQPLLNTSGIQGDIKLSLLHRRDVFHVMIIHVRNLTCRGTDTPSPYVKAYLLPDPDKHTKRKTKIARSSANPTFNELLEYKMSLEQLKYRILQVTVWDHDVLKENNFLGAVYIKLHNVKLTQEQCQWYPLQKLQMSGSLLS
ncbi:phosphatidylinositol 4-phosphate 3-kinase C2 domain-containing subunit alpha isoform X2 [Patella vulgata]|uniref:phosphatidylinositol 4-phosphate 3-kinase C2 domain-containing subunit alpha isoform X2 n=1 Tax=Patella vulgata TaxID=6465 RepID=UPI0024A7FCAC|nr:phosphatidylinositol 4-phosphate 3-kinase C2 domain-containing subunit alpha isoform X2 [Patella vulgata]XP_055957547.1 phosphatidylinositol 4-phosphate 3-kinase C2 domain-containing subunit alpha isoform X2 [Patella vulgata]